METRNARFWRALEKKAKIWMENSSDEPSFVMLYLPKPNKSRPVPQIKFFGSSNMKKFVEDVVVRKKFVETCEKPIEVEEPKKLKVFHPREPDTYTMDDLRILASCLVREEVSFKHGVNRDFWGNSIYRPEWWPDNVKFQSPHERRKAFHASQLYCIACVHGLLSFVQHKNYAEVGRMLSSATWDVFLNLAQVIASMLPKATERLRSSLEHDKCVNVHIPGFSPGYSLTQGDCLFSSLSYLWTGNVNQMVHEFRIGAAAHAALHLEHHLRKLISEGFSSVDDVRMLLESFCPEEVRQKSPDTDNSEELLKYILQEEARLTAKPNCYSGPIQVHFLAGSLDQSIQMHSINLLKGYNECIHPCTCQTITKDPIHILWINKAGDEVGHVVPLIPIQQQKDQQEGDMYSEPNDEEAQFANSDHQFLFSEKSIRLGFVRKVYSILLCQLMVTCAFMTIFLYVDEVKEYSRKNIWLWIVAFVLTFVTLIAMACCENLRRQFPMNLIFLSIFTLCESYLLGAVASCYDAEAVLIAAGITAVVALALTIFAFQTKWDFTMMGGLLFVFLIVLIVFGILAAILHNKILEIVYASIGALIFSAYLVFDTQMMLGGKHKYALSPEEYIFAALNLYLDVINLFLFILRIVGAARN